MEKLPVAHQYDELEMPEELLAAIEDAAMELVELQELMLTVALAADEVPALGSDSKSLVH